MVYSSGDKLEVYTSSEKDELVMLCEYDNGINVSYAVYDKILYIRIDDKVHRIVN